MGEVNVDRMLDKISLEQFTDWMAYTQIQGPIDDTRGDAQVGHVRLDLYNIFRGKKSAKSRPDEFRPKWVQVKTNSGWEHNKQMAYLIASLTSGAK